MAADSFSQNTPAGSGFVSKVLDCEELDDYLSSLLLPQVLHAVKYLPFRLPASNVKSFLSFLTLYISVKRNESSPACKALGLKMHNPRKSVYFSLTIYAFIKLVLPSLKDKIRRQIHQNGATYPIDAEGSGATAEQLARQRQQKILRLWLHTLDRGIPLVRLLLLLKCWAKLSTAAASPNMEKWLSGFQYQSISSGLPSRRQSIHVLYAHRRWMQRWLQACVPILVLPLLHSARESRDLLSYWIEYVDWASSRCMFALLSVLTSPTLSFIQSRPVATVTASTVKGGGYKV